MTNIIQDNMTDNERNEVPTDTQEVSTQENERCVLYKQS